MSMIFNTYDVKRIANMTTVNMWDGYCWVARDGALVIKSKESLYKTKCIQIPI